MPRKFRVRSRTARWAIALGALALASQPLLLAVPTTVIPPVAPADPVSVLLVDYGRTPALVLPVTDDVMVAYVYGDWNYYDLGNHGPFDSVAALLWPTQGALGRKEIAGRPTIDVARKALGNVQDVHTLQVERTAAERLRTTLERMFQERVD